MPKKDPYGFGNFMDVGGDFLDFAKKDMGYKGGPKNKDFLSYVNEGDNQLYGDYTQKPVGKGGNRKGRPKISNNPNEFGISLQALGDSVMYTEKNIYHTVKRGTKLRNERKERFMEKKYEKVSPARKKRFETEEPKGFQQKYLHRETRPVLKKIGKKIQLKVKQHQVKQQLKKYYHPKQKQEQRREEEPQRFRNQKRYR